MADDDGRATEMMDQRGDVVGDCGSRIGGPIGAGISMTTDVHGRDTVAGCGERGSQETVGGPRVSQAVNADDEWTCGLADHVVGDGTVGERELPWGHRNLREWVIHQS